MLTTFIFQIDRTQPYPFQGPKPEHIKSIVRVQYFPPDRQQLLDLGGKIDQLLTLKTNKVIWPTRVKQIRGKGYVLDYEYVAEPLRSCKRIANYDFQTRVRAELQELCRQLADKSIRNELKIEHLGVTEQGEIKAYIGLDWKIQKDDTGLQDYYDRAIQQIGESVNGVRDLYRANSDLSASSYSIRLDRRLTQMEDRLNKVSRKSSHRSSRGRSPKKSKAKKNSQDHITIPIKTKQQPILPTSSSMAGLGAPVEKTHKNSFGEYSTASNKLDDSSSSSLTKRISEALEKTRDVFNSYQRFSRKFTRTRGGTQ